MINRVTINWAIVTFFIGLALTFTVGSLSNPHDSTDDPDGHRSGLAVLTDCLTGRQYLMAYKGGLTPRLTEDGHQMIEKCTK